MKYYIYSLEHPITHEVRYIGKTNNLRIRYNQHTSIKEKENNYKDSWIKSLRKQGFKPIMSVIEEFDNEDKCLTSEIYWISQFKAMGFRLTNLSNGGKGSSGYNMKEVTKKDISKTLKERFKVKKHPMTGTKWTKERVLKMSLLRKGKKLNCKPRKNRKPVLVYKNGVKIDELLSIDETSEKYNIESSIISRICSKKRTTPSKGLMFYYAKYFSNFQN